MLCAWLLLVFSYGISASLEFSDSCHKLECSADAGEAILLQKATVRQNANQEPLPQLGLNQMGPTWEPQVVYAQLDAAPVNPAAPTWSPEVTSASDAKHTASMQAGPSIWSDIQHIRSLSGQDEQVPLLSVASEADQAQDPNLHLSQAQINQLKLHLSQAQDPNGGDIDLGTYGVSVIPAPIADKMVISNPFKCAFLIDANDPRYKTCGKTAQDIGIKATALNVLLQGTVEYFNAARLQFPLGSLPCCTTDPYCAAPSCNPNWLKAPQNDFAACTKYAPAANFAYMTHPDVYPAYHGVGGSFELDLQKHWDLLSYLLGFREAEPNHPPFDLVIDLGANSGLVTERLVSRRFAKDYILVEASPPLRDLFNTRLGDPFWQQKFLSEQSMRQGAAEFKPHFEWLTHVLSDESGGMLDSFSYQYNWADWKPEQLNTTAEVATVDSIIPSKLSADFTTRFKQAQSAYVKIDTEGFDEKVLRGMKNLLQEKRGDGFLVNFMMLEFCAQCMERVRETYDLDSYDLKTLMQTLEDLGFEAFIIGPRYLPLTHGSWDDQFLDFSQSPESQRCNLAKYPKFKDLFPEAFPEGECTDTEEKPDTFSADIFAIRSSFPKAPAIKGALGSCKESGTFSPNDPQYEWKGMALYDW